MEAFAKKKGKAATRGSAQIVRENVETLAFYRNMIMGANGLFFVTMIVSRGTGASHTPACPTFVAPTPAFPTNASTAPDVPTLSSHTLVAPTPAARGILIFHIASQNFLPPDFLFLLSFCSQIFFLVFLTANADRRAMRFTLAE